MALAKDAPLSLPQRVDAPVTLRLVDGDEQGAIETNALQIFVGGPDDCCHDRVPVAGRIDLDGHTLTFTPTFGFVAGLSYVAQIRVAGEEHPLVPFRIPSEAATMDAAVTEIFPSGDLLPENVLRFYIHFSVPMAPHVAFDHIQLRNASGEVDDAAFMHFKQELWNEDRRRLTVLMDPGRIKRGVATNVKLGPALQEGQQYRLTVVGGWPSADGTSRLAEYSKTFTVSEGIRERPDVGRWQALSACAGTREALEVRFDRPFDRHLLTAGIRVVTSDGKRVNGTVHIGESERVWRFTPNEAWAEDVRIVVDGRLEDVAGNNFRDLLDTVVGHRYSHPPGTELAVPLLSCGGRGPSWR